MIWHLTKTSRDFQLELAGVLPCTYFKIMIMYNFGTGVPAKHAAVYNYMAVHHTTGFELALHGLQHLTSKFITLSPLISISRTIFLSAKGVHQPL